jgi:3-dehydroquinate dehydratase II
MNLLGTREPELYGRRTYSDLIEYIEKERGSAVGNELSFFQSNHEGAIIDYIQNARESGVQGIVINGAGYSHTSIAIMDAIKAVGIKTVEVHITDIEAREEYRRHSYIAEVAIASIAGEGFDGYLKAIDILCEQCE